MAGHLRLARRGVEALRVLARIRAEGREVATDAERAELAQWCGWGPMARMFAPDSPQWEDIAGQVKDLLPGEHIDAGLSATYSAFFTPEPVAQAMWAILAATGFSGGRVLEPGCGAGVFMRTAPAGVRVTGVERDPVTAAVCGLVNPGHEVIAAPLQSARLGGEFAAAIGNVPFGRVRVADPTVPESVRSGLHNYCLYRAVEALAPGGVAVLLTSRFTLDSLGGVRDALAAIADFLGAVRLPAGAFGGVGTDVVADVVILRRREAGTPAFAAGRWAEVLPLTCAPGAQVNRWWFEEPTAVLGELVDGGTTRYGRAVIVRARPGDPEPAQGLARVGAELVARAVAAGRGWSAPPAADDSLDMSGVVTEDGVIEGTIRRDPVTGQVSRVVGGRWEPVDNAGAELVALLDLRDATVALVAAEADYSQSDEALAPLRERVASAYAAYVRRFGPLNRSRIVAAGEDPETGMPQYRRVVPRMGGFRRDPDAATVLALEQYDDETGQATPAPILRERQNRPPARPTHTADPTTALWWCLDATGGRVDLDTIAGYLQVEAGQVPELLGDLVYLDPASGAHVVAEEYLSGNVRAKLEAARLAAETAPERFERNVAALEAVLPPWLGPGEIAVNLGAGWVGPEVVAQFLKEITGHAVEVYFDRSVHAWEVKASPAARASVAAREQWGTDHVDAFRLVSLALNGRAPLVYVSVSRKERRKDPHATALAVAKQSEIRERFATWIWEEPERRDRLVEVYNMTFNSHVPRTYRGDHVSIEGMAPWFKPYPHQLEFVARALATPAALCGHSVGAGKTATMAMLALKLRQTGLARKPLVVVPNHLIEQIDREFRQLFPGARILSASAGMIRENRRAFAARCATQEWDAVLITHSAFNSLPVSAEAEIAYVADGKAAIRTALDGELSPRQVKDLARRIDSFDARTAELRRRARGSDGGITFDQLGCDYLIIDEAHYYKNLSMPVRADGFSVRPSKRATDLDLKLRWLSRRGSGRYAALFTGTPVSNTMLELFVMKRYLAPELLDRLGVGTPDAWASTFVQFAAEVEVTHDGGDFQVRTRPRQFVNAPELARMVAQVADIRTGAQLGLARPAVVMRTIAVDPTPAQQAVTAELVARAERLRTGGRRAEKGEDNMLSVCFDGRRLATDPALIGVEDPDPGKLDRVAAEVARVWREHPEALQIVFCDLGTPNPDRGAQTYGRLRERLEAAGVDRSRVRFVHDARSDADRASLFRDCRAGKVSVIIGSTDKLGVGTNIQDRVVAMHHVDAPWRPADVEQREGRGLRPGNRYGQVLVCRYVTRRTFDAYMWQTLERKSRFIAQVLHGTVTDRTVEDVGGGQSLSYEEVKAAATDQPLLLAKARMEAEASRLRALAAAHEATRRRAVRDLPGMRRQAEALDAEAAAWEAVAGAADRDAVTVEAVAEIAARVADGGSLAGHPVGGVTVSVRTWMEQTRDGVRRQPLLLVKGGAGTGAVELKGYRHWTAVTLRERLARLIDAAGGTAANLRQRAADTRADVARLEQLQEQPYERAAELARVEADLSRLAADLESAAQGEAPTGDYAAYLPAGGDEAGEGEDVPAELVEEAAALLAELDGAASGELDELSAEVEALLVAV